MDVSSSTAGILVFIALVLINGIISASLASLVNARKQNLRIMLEAGNKRAGRVLEIAEDATPLLSSRQFVNVLAHFLGASVLILTVARPLNAVLIHNGLQPEVTQWIVYPAAWLIGAVLMLLFGELIPTALIAANPERLALAMIGPIRLLLRMLSPVAMLMLEVSNRVASSVGGRVNTPYVTQEEIKTLVDAGQEEGVIEVDEKEMIYSIFQFSDKVVREVMVPRIDMVALDMRTTVDKALDTILAEGHSRIPIYEGTVDKVVGVLYAKDLLSVLRENLENRGKNRPVSEVMRTAYFVPESKRADALLEELQHRKTHMAIVIDEYGGTAGLVTIEDLLEEIVGEIQDEYDPDEEAQSRQIGPNEYLFDASISLGDVNQQLGITLSKEESDTLGGYIYSTLGHVPQAGEGFESDGLLIRIESITGRRIRKVHVTRTTPQKDEHADETGDSGGGKRSTRLNQAVS